MGRKSSDKRSLSREKHHATDDNEDSMPKNQKNARVNWNGDIGDAVISLYVSEYNRYKSNKAQTARVWEFVSSTALVASKQDSLPFEDLPTEFATVMT